MLNVCVTAGLLSPRNQISRRWRQILPALLLIGSITWPARDAEAAKAKHPLRKAQYTRNPLRNINGTVHDQGDEPLRGAVVQIEAEDTMVIQSYVTDDRGIYHFRNLRPDADYQIWATFRGHRSKHHSISKFDRNGDRVIPLVVDLNKD